MATILITEQEMCDCAACPGSARMAPRWACGCEEDICPDCGCCLLCCEDDHDDDAPWLDENYPREPPTGEPPSEFERMYGDEDEWDEDNDLPF